MPVERAKAHNATKETLLFYATLVALHYILTSSRLAMAISRSLTLSYDLDFLITPISDFGKESESDDDFEGYLWAKATGLLQ